MKSAVYSRWHKKRYPFYTGYVMPVMNPAGLAAGFGAALQRYLLLYDIKYIKDL
jgi:hypothetical protein